MEDLSPDPFPRWPPEWLEIAPLEAEQSLASAGDVEFITGMRVDGHILLSVTWPGGRRYMVVDPEGEDDPRALRIGEVSEDAEIRRVVEALWSQALKLAKQLVDGELQLPQG